MSICWYNIFANMGDGTYFHSGLLAIRQAVAAEINITYKLLYNSAVAMTGGQAVDGELSVTQLVDQIHAEGVETIVIVTDDPKRYGPSDPVRAKVSRIKHRDHLETLQRELRDQPGVSVIVYEQMCATEKRRMRKRGKLPDPATRVFINDLVCEGCGDCSAKSNCLSVEPIDTEFGTKRRINQSSCNKDFSCLNGFCPSFVTVEGAAPRKSSAVADIEPVSLPLPVFEQEEDRIVVAGVGGTGVVTIGALIAMSAHIQGQQVGVLDQVGMAQKGGAVVSHVHVSSKSIAALRIPAETASLIMICDNIVGNMRDVMAAIAPGRTHVLLNEDVSITGDFTQDRNARPDGALLKKRVIKRAGETTTASFPFTQLSIALLGDAIGANLMMVGYAWQRGWLRLDYKAFSIALELNNTAVALNRAAFAWGRKLALDEQSVIKSAGLDGKPETAGAAQRRKDFLTAYQNSAYAARYQAVVDRTAAAEKKIGGDGQLAEMVGKALFQLMSYKDEYEVARLYTDGTFAQSLGRAFDGPVKLTFHMAPPLLARRDETTGELRKRAFGGWLLPLLRLLAKGRWLRGKPFDPFGHTAERKMERRLISDYELLIDQLIARLNRSNHSEVVRIAAMALEVRGFGHVKEKAVAAYEPAVADALKTFRDSALSAVSDQ